MLRKSLLACGILSSLLYAGMTIVIAQYSPGYDSASQTISELSAVGAPTQRLWMIPASFYVPLVVAFGWGVWRSAGRSRALKTIGGLLVAYGGLGLLWPFAPMHTRETIAAGGGTFGDTLHIILASLSVMLMMAILGIGAAALGKRFRVYTIATLIVLLVFGILTFLDAPRLSAGEPTPWIGVYERINVGAFLLWVVVLALALWPDGRIGASGRVFMQAPRVDGHVSRGFEPVRRAFVENFVQRRERGGACAAYLNGTSIVDLWGGTRTRDGAAWERDTMVVVHSASKGLAAMTLAIAHSRGWLDYEERVAAYWPEFAQHGKEAITVRQLLAHQAGLFAINEPVDRDTVADPDRLAGVLARQTPAWEPGTRQAYHALTLGFYESELLRRIDPAHRTLGRFFHDEIAAPLGLDLYLRLPPEIPDTRLAVLAPPSRLDLLVHFPLRLTLDAMNPRSNIYRALVVNPGTGIYIDQARIYTRDLEVPSGNAVGTARSIARVYGVFASGGSELGLRAETLALLAAPAVPSSHGFHDECLRGEVEFSLGFMKPCAAWPFGSPSAFGAPGSGGSLGFADPTTGLGYAYVTSQMGTSLTGDPRDLALRRAIDSSLAHTHDTAPAAA